MSISGGRSFNNSNAKGNNTLQDLQNQINENTIQIGENTDKLTAISYNPSTPYTTTTSVTGSLTINGNDTYSNALNYGGERLYVGSIPYSSDLWIWGNARVVGLLTLHAGFFCGSATIDSTEIATLDGIDTSQTLQDQLNSKANKSGTTFTGLVLFNSSFICNSTTTFNAQPLFYDKLQCYFNIKLNSTAGIELPTYTITQAELSYLHGVTSNIQTQLNSKFNLTGGAITGPVNFTDVCEFFTSTLFDDNVTFSGNLLVASAIISPTELSYLDNVTSNIQTQLNSKFNSSGGAISGNVTFNGTTTFNSSATFNNGISLPDATMTQQLSGAIIQYSLLSSGSNNNFKPSDFFGNITMTGTTSTTNKFTQSTAVAGDVTGNNNLLKYTQIRYNSNTASGTSSPCLTLLDTYNSNSIFFLPNTSGGAYNGIVTVNGRSIIAAGTIDNNNISLTNWGSVTNGVKCTATNSTTANVLIQSGSNSITVSNSSGISINSSTVSFSQPTVLSLLAGSSLTNEIKCYRFNCYYLVEFPDGSVQNTAYTNSKDTKLTAIGTTSTATLNTTTLTTGTDTNVATALSLSAGTYIITWICGFHVMTGSTTIGNYSAGYTTSSSTYTDIVARGSFIGQTCPLDTYFTLSGSTTVTFASTTSIYLRCTCVFGTASRVEFRSDISQLKAVRIA